jgi:CYTH domain-containing protein
MALEIEQKFTVDADIFYQTEYSAKTKSTLIEQGYLQKDDNIAVRVRITDKDKASLDVKIRVSDTIRQEFEYPIPIADANEMLSNVYIIRKRRYDLGNKLTVDEFLADLQGLYLAEKEFEHEDELHDFVPPMWCTRDVTSDPQYINCNLMNKKFEKYKIVDL